MNQQTALQQSPPQQTTGKSLPDVNAQIYPYDTVQKLLDQTANFSMFAVPVPGYVKRASLNAADSGDWFNLHGGYGLDWLSVVHRFESMVDISGRTVKVSQSVGDATGNFHCLCLFSPPDFRWDPRQVPPPWIFDPYRSQHFVMQDCELTFSGDHTCQFYGVGRTFPLTIGGRHVLLAGGVANLVKGTGKFEGREGTLVCTGTLTPELGFLGNLNLRVRDDQETLVTENELIPLDGIGEPDRQNTFIELRLIKKNKHVKTTFGLTQPGAPASLITPSIMRAVQYSYATGLRGPRTHMSVGQVLGPMEATVSFDLAAPPGNAESPVPFTTQELYTFTDSNGATVGTISCGVVEGQSFDLKFPSAPGQPGVRFAGFGPIQGGTGPFAGVQGLLSVNSLIGISPHALSLMHALQIVDPVGKFRAG